MIIFAVDDERLNLSLLTGILSEITKTDFVYSFTNPLEALNKAKETKPDICFLDIQMPAMTGVELAKEIIKINPKVNIIFATGFDEYRSEAMDMFASGYVLKPVSKEKLEVQLAHLRYPIQKDYDVYAQTFGTFMLFAKGAPVHFHRSKSKEVLAYLIHKKDKVVSRKELSRIIFNDEEYSRERQKQLDVITHQLEIDLKEHEIDFILSKTAAGFFVASSKLNADLYDYLSNNSQVKYNGEYMKQFEWGQEFKNKH